MTIEIPSLLFGAFMHCGVGVGSSRNYMEGRLDVVRGLVP